MITRLLRLTAALPLVAFVLSAAPSGAAPPAPSPQESTASRASTQRICAAAAAHAEKSFAIPGQLLGAVSLAESARWDKESREKYAWPWTVTWDGEGRYYATKAEAVRVVRELRKKGVRNIDVGCLQVNLHYHPDAFDDLEDALDPRANAAYAGKFLSALWTETKSWTQAVSRYHSSDPKRGQAYRRKVFLNWQQERRRFFREAYEARKSARESVRADLPRAAGMAQR